MQPTEQLKISLKKNILLISDLLIKSSLLQLYYKVDTTLPLVLEADGSMNPHDGGVILMSEANYNSLRQRYLNVYTETAYILKEVFKLMLTF
jgi:hypothetical protein